MLNSRTIAILRELLAVDTPITSEYLANVIQVTSRTIRNDIKELETIISKYGASIKSIRGAGYTLKIDDDKVFRKFLLEEFQSEKLKPSMLPNTPEERVHYLMQRLLLTENFLKLEDLADELFISKSTVQNDLKDVKKTLQTYDLSFEVKPNYGLKVKGEEVKLRFCMSEYVFNRIQTEYDLHSSQKPLIPIDEMKMIRAIILEQIKENDITLSDIGLNNLIIHIAIACRRITDGNYVILNNEELKDVTNQKEYGVANKIVREIENRMKVDFPETEIAYVAIHLLGTRMIRHLNNIDGDLRNYIDKDIYRLTMEILDSIETKLTLGLKDDLELIVAIGLHLKPAISRYRYGMNLRNPMIDEIKSNYPIAFEAGIIAGMVLKRDLGIDIDENEVGYLALHIGAAIERRAIHTEPKRCMIVCASGVGSARLLSYKLQSKFGARLEIVGTTEYYKLNEVPFDTLDFIVSTIPIKESLPVPVIVVNTFLGGNDFERVEKELGERKHGTLEYTKKELVFLQEKFETKEEVLCFLGDKLEKLGLVDSSFIDAVLEREALSPTSFGNLVAIPHPITPKTDSTFWAICTLQKPIDWGGKRVQFICLLSIEKNSSTYLQKMYALLVKIVEDIRIVQQLLKCKTYDEFLEVF
ncbi:BglG family transcription antiterminator [Neobacillus sp. YX16]|uniref:BglG family transcription antiterminator n=1 Tax=Neobacillus sp. YX16 TaxID=3047874 RepID=UPI0024C229AE|nr:BglG family transcription antiterminator [Neobacillus sp. YX16]WHZ03823.1 BglG family transcription antiterminator [Neobacillus sp. YX16]